MCLLHCVSNVVLCNDYMCVMCVANNSMLLPVYYPLLPPVRLSILWEMVLETVTAHRFITYCCVFCYGVCVCFVMVCVCLCLCFVVVCVCVCVCVLLWCVCVFFLCGVS